MKDISSISSSSNGGYFRNAFVIYEQDGSKVELGGSFLYVFR